MMASGTMWALPDHMTPKSFSVVPGPLILCEFTAQLLCYRRFSKACKACKVFCNRGKLYVINVLSFTEAGKENNDRS